MLGRLPQGRRTRLRTALQMKGILLSTLQVVASSKAAELLPAGNIQQEAAASIADNEINYGLCSQALQCWVVQLEWPTGMSPCDLVRAVCGVCGQGLATTGLLMSINFVFLGPSLLSSLAAPRHLISAFEPRCGSSCARCLCCCDLCAATSVTCHIIQYDT
jgi:hypothetical protein